MKQELPRAEHSAPPSQSLASRSTRASKAKETPKAEGGGAAVRGLRTRPNKHAVAPPEVASGAQKSARRPVLLPDKIGEESGAVKEKDGDSEDSNAFGPHRPRSRAVEQYARLRPRKGDPGCKAAGEELVARRRRDDLEGRLRASETLVKELQSEVLSLKTQLEKLQSINNELESKSKRCERDLAAAEAQISSLQKANMKMQDNYVSSEVLRSEFSDIRNVTANKPGSLRSETESKGDLSTVQLPNLVSQSLIRPGEQGEIVSTSVPFSPPPIPPPPQCPHPALMRSANCGPPPPPPPPPSKPISKSSSMQKASSLVEFYQSLTKHERKKGPAGASSCGAPVPSNAHSSIVGEIQNRSAHLLAIKADVESKGDFVKFLIDQVQSAAYLNIDDVLVFVDWLDKELSTLADERAVLKHFNWPERKFDAMREAAFEYRALKQLGLEASLFEDDTSIAFEASQKKVANLLDRLERSVQRLVQLRDAATIAYRQYQIPSDWMLDSGIISKLKLASVKLAKVSLKRVSTELESIRHSERETLQEPLLLQCIRFAFRVQKFAGGLDMETLSAFDDLRQRLLTNESDSRELLPSIRVN